MPNRAAPRLAVVQFLERRTRRQWWLIGAVASVAVTWIALRGVSSVLLDRWWLDTVTDAPIWSRRASAQLELAVAAMLVVVTVVGGSVWVVLRVATHDHGPLHRMWQRYHERFGPAHRWALIGVIVYLTWHIGRAATGQWQSWLLFRHGNDLGTTVPELGTDLGFHLFRLPLLVVVSSFLRQIVVVAFALSLFGHLASGALRWPGGDRRSSPTAVAHLVWLSIVLLGLQAIHDVVVARPLTATNRIGSFDGPGFTEIEVTRPMLTVAAAGCVALGFAIVAAARASRPRLVIAGAAALALVHVAGLVVAPMVSELLVVAPAEADRQLWSIANNLDATRHAYGLDRVDIDRRDLVDGLTGDRSVPAFGDDRGIPLFDTAPLASSLQVLAGTTGTRIRNVDVAAYEIDGISRPVYTAARPPNLADLPETGWVQQHLVYTHGDGVVAFAADAVDRDGRPDVAGSAGAGPLTAAAHSPLYYGEGLENWYAIAGTRRREADGAEYIGDGVALGSLWRRATVALALGESEPLLSSEVVDTSTLLYRRGLAERIGAVAPFLRLDHDPYVVVDGESVTWVNDAYTIASSYPYAQFAPADSPFSGANYVHASIIATVDAADGGVHLYRTETDDPVIAAWADVFPGLFEPIGDLPDAIASHVRYPEDLLELQTTMLGRYHVTDAEDLFGGTDRWTVSPAAPTTVGAESSGPAPAVDLFATGDRFQAVRTFGPGAAGNPQATRDELTALAIADHGVSRELRLVVPSGAPLLSPQVAQSAIDADPTVAQDITLLNANGSHVEFGPITPVLVGDGVVWARPIIVIGTSPAAAPRLYGIAAVSNGEVGIGATIQQALDGLT